MGYLHLLDQEYPVAHSKAESIAILERYKPELSIEEYNTILDSLCNLAFEGFYLDEKDILFSIAQLRDEITLEEIVEQAKAS